MTHVLVDVSRPSWLVLGEGYNRAWQAWCGGRSLGTPVPIDGYANGWRVGPGCRHVRFSFAPNRLAAIGYIVSGLAAVACMLLLLGGAWRRRRRGVAPSPAPSEPAWTTDTADPQSRWSPVRALVVAVIAGAAFGFAFGLHAGAVSVVVLWLILWRGVGARALTLLAGALLGIVVPILYLTASGNEDAGNQAFYVIDHNTANWVGVAAIGLLMVALWRTLRDRYVLGRRR